MNRYFASSPNQPRVRRASHVWLLGLGLLLFVWTALNVGRVADAETALIDLASSAPLWFEQLYRIAYLLGLVLVWGVFIMVLAQGKRRLDLLRDILIAVALVAAAVLWSSWWLDGSPPTLFPDFVDGDREFTFPILRVATMTAVLTVSSQHLSRPVRRFGWLMLALVAISAFGLGFGLPSDAVGGIGIGFLAGSVVLLVFGSPSGYPDKDAVKAGLGDLGLQIHEFELAKDRSWGVRRFTGSLTDRSPIDVKAYGRDAVESQRFARAWHSLWYRAEGESQTLNRFAAVEHEALALLSAQRSGVHTAELLAVGRGGDDIALLAVSRLGEAAETSDVTSEVLSSMWREVDVLHRAGMSHGALTLEAFSLDGEVPVINDFVTASMVATDATKSLDCVSLLYSTAIVAGADTAVDSALAGIGEDAMVEALPFLQTPAIARTQRRRHDKPKVIVADLRDAIATSTETELPEPAKLRRVRPKDLIMPALSLVAAYALVGMLADIDFVAVWEVMESATWAWIIVGFFVGQFVFLPEATGMLYATGYPLPLRPLVVLQVSVKWIGLAVPSAAGRVTMNALFLRKYGVSSTLAVTQGALDGLAGFTVEATILLIAFIASDLTLQLDTGGVNWQLILLIVVLLVVGTVVAVFRIRRLRDAVIPPLRDAWTMLVSLLRDPKRTFGLLGSNLASRMVLAVVLWFILQAIGTPLPLVTALVVTVATNLLAGLVPIPGGIGVAEAVMTSFLIVVGLGPDEAFAVAVVFRLATFYIPAGEGFIAMRWLETNDYL